MPAADWLRASVPGWANSTAAGACLVRSVPLPDDPARRGAAAEWLLAAAVGAALWHDVPAWVREALDGIAGDHGADALGLDAAGGLVLWQFKWYAAGRAASYAARAQLETIAGDWSRSLGEPVAAAYALRAGMRPYPYPGEAALARFRRGVSTVRFFTYADLGVADAHDADAHDADDADAEFADAAGRRAVAGARPAILEAIETAAGRAKYVHECASEEPGPDEDPRRAHQGRAVSAALARYAGGDRVALVVMATGTGKSWVAAGVAAELAAAGGPPVLIVAPRLEIVGGLAAVFGAAGWKVFRVGDCDRWPDARSLAASRQRVAIVASAQSLSGQLPPGARFALVVRDEAHNGTGAAALAAHAGAAAAPALLLTATPAGTGLPRGAGGAPEPAYALPFPQAAAEGLVCDPEFVFVGFAASPTPATLAADLLARPHAAALVVYNSQEGARALHAALEAAAPGAAGLLVSSEQRPPAALAQFRAGRLRVLVAVDMVSMGVDVPRCDAVVIAEPRGSAVDVAQLMGRACRLCPETKPGRRFAVLIPRAAEALADADASAAELAGALRIAFGDAVPAGAIRAEPAAGAAPAGEAHARPAGEAYARIAERIFDSSARALGADRGDRAADRLGAARREFDSWPGRIAGRCEPNAASLAALAARNPGELAGVPADPAARFAELFGGAANFPWRKFVGARPDDPYCEIIRDLVADDRAGVMHLLRNNPRSLIAIVNGCGGATEFRDPVADVQAELEKNGP